MDIIITQPGEYEVCPGYTPERLLSHFIESKPILIGAFCMKERIDPNDIARIANEVLVDWELTEETHSDINDALRHLINHIRIKHRNEQRNNRTTPNTKGYGVGASREDRNRLDAYKGIAAAILQRNSGGASR